jgi:uncharacterized protein YyaL (SSP411 family)
MKLISKRNVIVLALSVCAGVGCSVDGPSPVKEARMTDSQSKKHTNRLANEASPYLRQHQHNPVDWYPWGDEAFAKAKKEDKPIFLSIGYSTCHWCHVMERESFEDDDVAKLLNEGFVSIKVDREERPDLDAIYMTVTQMMTGSGGWPMTVILTPDKQPFFAATYIPKESKYGRLGMVELLPKITDVWTKERERILASAKQMTAALESTDDHTPGDGLGKKELNLVVQQLAGAIDPVYGGLGRAPKFPSPHTLLLLLRRHASTGDARALDAVKKTLNGMRKGGIWDHVGYGFHRYSTDREWLLPHFEKMLYDQALLTMAYTEAHQITNDPIYAQTAKETMTYVMRELQAPDGGYYSAEDADSEGEEGKFYVWTQHEIENVLGDTAATFISTYGVKSGGNFHDETSQKQTEDNILHIKAFDGLANFKKERKTLFDLREKRIHPFKDRKVLTDWNGLMIGAAAYSGRVLGEKEFIDSATKAADFVLTSMRDENGRLHKRSFNGKSGLRGLLEDYAFMTWGLTELYQASGKTKYLYTALDLTDLVLKHFGSDGGGFFTVPDYGEKLIVRQMEIYDGAIPSGNSVMLYNLVRLGHMTGNTEWLDKAEKSFRLFSNSVERGGAGHAFLLLAVDLAQSNPPEVVLYGAKDDPVIGKMRTSINSNYLPHVSILSVDPSDKTLMKRIPKLSSLLSSVETPVAFVCRGFSCQAPTSDPDQLLKSLKLMGAKSE